MEEIFASETEAKLLFDRLRGLVESLGLVEMRVTKSQVSFRRRRGFAWAWMPGKYLRRPAAPLVLTVALPGRDESVRWKQVAEPAPGRFMHHLEIYASENLDEDVVGWLRQAWEAAG